MQVLANILIAAAPILLVALGFALVYRSSRFFHFAHAIVFTSGAYFAFACNVWVELPISLAIPLAVTLAAGLGLVIDQVVYRPLRARKASSLVMLLASLGTYIALQNVLSLVFGDDTKLLRIGSVSEGMGLAGARVTPVQIATVLTAFAVTAVVLIALKRTRLGLAFRAVASDMDLASVSGIPKDAVISLALVAGSALAGTAGILVALSSDMIPTMGMTPLMLAVVVVILSGQGSMVWLLCSSLLLAGAQQTVIWLLGAEWQDPVAFAILLGVVLLRPEGILVTSAQKVVR